MENGPWGGGRENKEQSNLQLKELDIIRIAMTSACCLFDPVYEEFVPALKSNQTELSALRALFAYYTPGLQMNDGEQ